MRSYVYFLYSIKCGLFKIGFSKNLFKRVQRLQQDSPDRLVVIGITPGGKDEEKAFHRRFSEHRLHGEWFYAGEDLINYALKSREKWIASDYGNEYSVSRCRSNEIPAKLITRSNLHVITW